MVVVVTVVTYAVAGFNSRYTYFFLIELIVILQVAVIM